MTFQTASAVWFFVGGNLIKQSNGLEFLYDHTGVFAVKYNNATYFYRKNAQQDIIALLDNTGATVVKYKYDAWGKCVVDASTTNTELANFNPFRYRSYYFDTETNLYFLKTRYYDPEVGRFMTIDDISYIDPESINGLNLYAYCGNKPVMGHDPNGTWDWGTFFKGVALVFTAIGAIAVSIATFGLATPLAMTIVAGVTLGAGILTGINGIATVVEAGTNYNFIRDGLFNEVLGLSDTAYGWYAGITESIAIVGAAICTMWNVTNPIKGFTDHGRQSTLTHDAQGVNAKAMQDAVRNPLKVVHQSNGGIKHVGKNAVVVLNSAGKVITTYAKNHHGWRFILTLWLGSELISEKLNY